MKMLNDDLIDPNYYPEGGPGRVYDPTAKVKTFKYTDFELGIEKSLDPMLESWGTPYGKTYGTTLGEMLEANYDWNIDAVLPYTMSEEAWHSLKPRIKEKIDKTFYFREMATFPLKKWEIFFHRELEQILNELGPLYQNIYDEGKVNILDQGLDEESNRTVYSKFPQARIQSEQKDYATDSTEYESQKVAPIAQLDAWVRFSKGFTELDKMVTDHMESHFLSFY